MPYDLNPLGYAFDALEPHVPAAALERHREEIHRSYIVALNRLLSEHDLDDGRTIEDLLRGIDNVPPGLRQQVSHLGGGHANHQFLWKIVGPQPGNGAGAAPVGELGAAIDAAYGSFAGFREIFEDAAGALGTEGWAFLSLSRPRVGDLEIVVLPGNGSVLPIAKPGILICDLWDHGSGMTSFPAFWNIIDWTVCNDRFIGLRAGKSHL